MSTKDLEICIGIPSVELAAEAQCLAAVIAKVIVQATEEAEGNRAAAARPSEVIPKELHRLGGVARAGLLELVLGEAAEALNLMCPAAEPDGSSDMVLHFREVHSAGEGAELHEAVAKELSELYHFNWASTRYARSRGVHDKKHDKRG